MVKLKPPHPTDIMVGKRIRQAREASGFTQTELADIIGVKFQQLQKYETAANRISASRLFELTEALGVSVTWIFHGTEKLDSPCSMDILEDTQVMRLLSVFKSLSSVNREIVRSVAKALTGDK